MEYNSKKEKRDQKVTFVLKNVRLCYFYIQFSSHLIGNNKRFTWINKILHFDSFWFILIFYLEIRTQQDDLQQSFFVWKNKYFKRLFNKSRWQFPPNITLLILPKIIHQKSSGILGLKRNKVIQYIQNNIAFEIFQFLDKTFQTLIAFQNLILSVSRGALNYQIFQEYFYNHM